MKKTNHPGVSQMKDGRLHVRVVATDPRTGKRTYRRKTLEHGATKEEALTVLAQMKEAIRAGHPKRSGPSKRRTVTDFAEHWLEGKARRVRPAVAEHYEQVLSCLILPRLGDYYLESVEREDVEDWVKWVERLRMKDGRPYARATIMGFWSILSRFLRDAAAAARIPDPTFRVDPPDPKPIQRRELGTLQADEVEVLLAKVKRFTPHRYAEVFMLVYTGMRAGELYALRWEDIKAHERRIKVCRSVWHGHVDLPKTGVVREVAYLAEMTPVIEEHRQRLVEVDHPGLEKGLVFPADNGGYRMPQSLHKPLAIAAKSAAIDVKVTPQVLRRTFNTLMVTLGVDRIVLRSQMGHSHEKMTELYSGVPIEEKVKAVKRLVRESRPLEPEPDEPAEKSRSNVIQLRTRRKKP